jgi:hypothetical protein
MKTTYEGALVPQTEENIQKAEWKTAIEIPELLDNAYENIKTVVEAVEG